MSIENQKKIFKAVAHQELPPGLQKQFDKATRLEWVTVFYIISVVIVMFLAMQSSQAMKAAWLEDILSMIPAISFLTASRYFNRKPNPQYPFGYHRAYSIAYQIGALSLLILGVYVLYDSVTTLLKGEKATIGSAEIFGQHIWLGWMMIAALLWSSIPSVILGQKKISLSKELHNKILFTDSHTQKADWQTAVAAIVGVLGIGMGYWWADAAAACFISVSITWDGWQRLKGAIEDLLDQVPTNLKNSEKHPVVEKVYSFFTEQPWVEDVRIRMREAGEIFFTEVFVIAKSMDNLFDNIDKAVEEVKKLTGSFMM